MYQGGCLCGAVRFRIDGEIRNIIYCHCSECRKAQGSAFATNGIVDAANFTLTAGEDRLSVYESGNGQAKYFCSVCGSPIMSRRDSVADQVRIRLGTIETDIAERPSAHIFVSSKANWDEIHDTLPRYDGYEPDRNR